MFCKNGNHSLVEILRKPLPFETDEVAKWCPNCGAIVVDIESDHRVYPGQKLKMQFVGEAKP